jgi:hypothetical protein
MPWNLSESTMILSISLVASHPTNIVSLKDATSVQLIDTQYGFSITMDDATLEFKAPDLNAQKKWVNGT